MKPLRTIIFSLSVIVAALGLGSGTLSAATFTPGNLAVFQAASSSANNTTCTILELSPSANQSSPVNSIAIDGTGANALRVSGSATSTGYLADSDDGTLLAFTGHNNTSTTVNANTLNPRGVGTLDAAGTFVLQTTYTSSSGNQTRGATKTNSSAWFIADQGGLYSNGSTTASPSGNFRGVKSFGGVVYLGQNSSTVANIMVAIASAPSGGTVTGLPGLTNSATFQDFYLISSGNNGIYDVLYILFDTSTTAGTIGKFSLVGGTWTANGSYTTTFGGFGLAAALSGGGGAVLYVTTGTGASSANSVIKVTDTAGYNSTINVTTANNVTLFTTAAGTTMKGIAFAPAVGCAKPAPFNVTGGNGCAASGVTIGLDGSDSGVNYQLLRSGGTVAVGSFVPGTGSAISFGNQTVADTYSVIATNPVGNCTATMNGNVTIATSVTPSVTVTQSPPGSVCASTTVIFGAIPVNGGTPTYVWKTNGVVVAGVTGPAFTNSTPVNNETIDVQMTSTATCASPATADAPQLVLSVTDTVTPSVSITANPGSTICAGTAVTFTAAPVNGGAPLYQWITNGVAVANETNSTFMSAGLQNGDVVTVVMTSTDPCRSTDTAASNPITMTVNPVFTPSVSLAANPGSTVCSNTLVTFTATPVNGGAAPSYQWYTNDVAIGSATSPTFATSSLKNGDVVKVVMTPSAEICVSTPTATSSVTMTVNPNFVPSVTVGANPSGPICYGTLVEFTATPVNGGASPAFQWRTNGVAVSGATSSTYTNDHLTNGDTVSVVLTPSSEICVSPATATSAPLTMTVNVFGLTINLLSENFGTSGSSLPAGWSATSAAIAWTVQASAVSSGYSGASGGNNVSMTLGGDSTTYLVSPTIDCSGLQNGALLTFGLRKSSASFTNHLVIDVSTDNGATWTAFTAMILNANMASGNWSLQTIDLGNAINGQSQVVIRWHFAASGNGSSSTSNVRLDDFRLFATPVTQAAITANGTATFCQGGSVILTASANGASYVWSTAETTRAITVTNSGIYSVTIFDANGCSGTASQSVTVLPLPNVTVNSATTCAGGSATLTASTTADNPSYLWSPGGATTASITVSPASTTNYTVTVTDGTTTCANSASGMVTVNPLPTVTVNSPVVCAGDAAILTASTTADNPSYLWSPGGATTPSITVSPTSTTTYTVTVTDGTTTCANSASGTVTINPPATVDAGPDQTIQAGSAATLAGTFGGGAASATWSAGSGTFAPNNTTPNATYTPSESEVAAGTVILTLTTDDPAGPCPAVSDSMTITINHAPVAKAASYDCSPGSSVSIQITGAGGLAADSDGDALTVTAGTPALGTATVVTNAGNIYINYLSSGAAGLDAFAYFVSDGRGGSASAMIALNVVSPGGQTENSLASPEIIGAGPDIRLVFLGIPTNQYALEWTHDLAPVISWVALVTNTAATNGMVIFTNTPSAPGLDFYRVRLVP